MGYVVQAIVNNFVPLLFVRMQSEFGVPLGKITLLITFNFGLQLLIDMFSTPFIEKIGYRASMLISNASVILGLALLTILPGKIMSPFAGISHWRLLAILWCLVPFALLALAGDLGCSGGPTVAGAVASTFGDNMRAGIGAAIAFPFIMGVIAHLT